MTTDKPKSALSLELILVIGVPVLSLVAGAAMLALAYSHAYTPLPSDAPVALHGS